MSHPRVLKKVRKCSSNRNAKGKMRKGEFAMIMRKSDPCDAMGLPKSANAMRMQKWIRITRPDVRIAKLLFVSDGYKHGKNVRL